MKIEIANIKDLENLTTLHCASFKPEEHVPMMLGKDYVRATYKWLITSNESYVLVARDNKKIMGLIAVCDGSYTKPMFIACLPEFIKSLLAKPTRLFSKLLWGRLFRKPQEFVGNIPDNEDTTGFAEITIGAVDTLYRGSGVFGELVSESRFTSYKRGSIGIIVGVYKKNNSSRRVFEKQKWLETKPLETIDTVFFRCRFDDDFIKSYNQNE